MAEELVGSSEIGEVLCGGSGLRPHVLDDSVGFARALVVGGHFAALEDLERGVAADAVLLAALGLDGAVDLDGNIFNVDLFSRMTSFNVVFCRIE